MLAPLLMLVQSRRADHVDLVVISLASCVLFVLVAVRMAGLLFSEKRAKLAAEDSYRKLQQADVQLRNAQKLKAIGQLSNGVAHEINTPLQFVMGDAAFIRESVTTFLAASRGERVEVDELTYLEDELPRTLENVIGGLDRVPSTVQALKRFGDASTEQVGSIDVNQLLSDIATIVQPALQDAGKLTLELEDIPHIMGESGAINQSLLHVVMNGIEAVVAQHKGDGAGIVSLTTSTNDNGEVVVSVTDNGTGISEGIRNMIFDPFFTTKEVGDGSGGQGLALTHSVITAHGGCVDVESHEGDGATMTITLPRGPGNTDATKRFGARSGESSDFRIIHV